jgi:hypothetical protein
MPVYVYIYIYISNIYIYIYIYMFVCIPVPYIHMGIYFHAYIIHKDLPQSALCLYLNYFFYVKVLSVCDRTCLGHSYSIRAVIFLSQAWDRRLAMCHL